MSSQLSVTIITLNEEQDLGKCLDSLIDLGAEVVLVDSGSTDKTVDIAKSFGATVFIRKFDNFANQKNFAVSKASGEWILAVDADEEIPAYLANEIKEAIKTNKYNGYLIPRRNFILGKEIKYSRWSPDTHIWLWKKDSGSWEGEVHEEVVVQGEIGLLKNSKIHNSHRTVADFMKTNNFYSILAAKSLFKKGNKFSFSRMFRGAFFEFIIRYFYKQGFRDGKEGFILAYLMGIYKLMVFIKLWEQQQEK